MKKVCLLVFVLGILSALAFTFPKVFQGQRYSDFASLKLRVLPQDLKLPTSKLSDIERQIFCNVELNGDSIRAVGFDMDYTLAQYNDEFELLAFNGAREKLLRLGYPQDALNFSYCPEIIRRGLIVDTIRGNILKVDRHKYVRKAYHGNKELTAAQRKAYYSQDVNSFTESHFINIDTLFQVADAIIFSQLVNYYDLNGETPPKSLDSIFSDVRNCVSQCHLDGTIKDVVMKTPEKFIKFDSDLVPMLLRYRQAGKKTFLLTNSMWEYTNSIMEFIVNGAMAENNLDWKSLFDVIIVGACKPAFLTEHHLSLFKVDKESGLLRNIEDKQSITPITFAIDGNVYQGGNWADLHRILDVNTGKQILYVGDHMFSDILHSKRTLGWRTCLIVPELERELRVARQEIDLSQRYIASRFTQHYLDEELDSLYRRQRLGENVTALLDEALVKTCLQKDEVKGLSDEYNSKFNQRWGQLFKAGHIDSRFSKQITDYACLYTSKATNLGLVSPNRPFRPIIDNMPHDHYISDDSERTNKQK